MPHRLYDKDIDYFCHVPAETFDVRLRPTLRFKGPMNSATNSYRDADRLKPDATWLRRALRPTIRKKILFLFFLLILIGVGNYSVILLSLSRLHGTATLINLTGSLRWLSQSIQLDTFRLVQGLDADRTSIEGRLKRLDDTLALLEAGGKMMRSARLRWHSIRWPTPFKGTWSRSPRMSPS